ncbi:GNAT family N-acetyltransferase [Saccharococcus thermophilus]|uniref:L-amino acid N-acyltransferase YncA n=1 Tax=Saccharococcus thermophilus TaxID=29396 RepID=A0A846MG59_9BACL|nr:L-amino acid N-acyltransferase YncA [Saccharococcus thermophilus]
MIIRRFRKEDWLQVKEIYEQGIATGQATFETTAPSFEKWESTIAANLCLVSENEEGIQFPCLTKRLIKSFRSIRLYSENNLLND